MPDEETDVVLVLEDALARVYDAKAIAMKGKLSNPDKDQMRDLNAMLAELELKRKALVDLIDALEDGSEPLPPPPVGLVTEIADLTGEVEQYTGDAVAASDAITVAGKVLDMAAKAASARA